MTDAARRFDRVPLRALMEYTIWAPLDPAEVAERGPFLVRDGWTRPGLTQGHRGTDCCFVLEFASGAVASGVLALTWSPLREKIIELVSRTGGPVGPCALVVKRLHPGVGIWCFVGLDDDGTRYDPLADLIESPPEPDETIQ